MTQRDPIPPATEREMLRAILNFAAEHEDDDVPLVSERARRAFLEMADKLDSGEWRRLFTRQASWVRGVYERVTGEPTYANDWSAGRVPRGREVEEPEVLKHRPLKPPARRTEEA